MGIAVLGQPLNPRNGDLALVGGTIYGSPTDEPILDGVVLIRDGKIAAVGARALLPVPQTIPSLDCAGLTITAGFWNSHVHFFERKWANAAAIPASELGRQIQDMFTRYGFTSVFDLSSFWENTRQLRGRVESGEVPGPRICSTGEGLVPPGAVPPDQVLNIMGMMRTPLPEISDAAQASAAARRLLDEGVDAIKLFASSPRGASLPESAIQAAVNEAHRLGKPAFTHPNSGVDVLTAVRAGVDIIAHTTPQSGPWDETILAAMKERRVALTPTYALMAKAGMSFRQILASLTTAPAGRLECPGAGGRTVHFTRWKDHLRQLVRHEGGLTSWELQRPI